ncbi:MULTISPECIES: BrnT family toxin [Paracoccus]|uniref:BrnT family toxin n=1 Tax=Paracoccus TaxID=265 RepID=UPI001E2E1D69|nr:BrnT family toxin [Paracoccus sp. MA]UFM63644.1 BrnT family toxin [Paracoccus sp. MA]
MKCTSDPAKRAKTLAERGLDLEADGAEILAGATLTFEDDRYDYGETRLISIGHLKGRMMVMVWTPRGETAHVISMRKANAREQKAYAPRF